MKRTLLASIVLAAIAVPVAASAPPNLRDAHAVIGRMLSSNPTLVSYRARVHIALHMLNFPFLSPQLDGTTYYKRPGSYEVVFDRVPFYMKGFSRLFEDAGDAATWERDQDVVLLGTQEEEGRRLLVLRMTKKIHSDVLDYTDAFIDARTYQLVRMEWHYHSGGTIVITQAYREQSGYLVPSEQHAAIDIPHVRAVGDATYGSYQVNVAVSEAIFSR
ncbi:MAG TPA: hypothetical protein VIN40_02660 [Candidatus Tyrphobacter sp.]